MPGSTFFAELAEDTRRIELDCGVLAGHWTARADLDAAPDRIRPILARGGIDSAVVVSGMAVMYDEARGNAQALEWAEDLGWTAAHAVNLRDCWGIEEKLAEWHQRGVRAIRLQGVTQLVPVTAPGYRATVRAAASLGLTILVEGNFNTVQHAFRDLGAAVVFLDMGYYETADFMIAAREEPGFVASTRRLLGPDSLEIVCEQVGAQHVAFGSGVPLQDLEPTVWRLRDARLAPEEFRAVAGGTMRGLLER